MQQWKELKENGVSVVLDSDRTGKGKLSTVKTEKGINLRETNSWEGRQKM